MARIILFIRLRTQGACGRREPLPVHYPSECDLFPRAIRWAAGAPAGYNPAVMRFVTAVIFNVLVPGAGLILLGRAWTGLVAALLFAVCAELAVCGVVISPAGIPLWLTVTTGILAAGTWVLGQGMLADRIRTLRNPSLPQELEALRREAAEAMARGDLLEAKGVLRLAADLDLGATETLALWARLMTLLGRFRDARRAWVRVSGSGEDRFVREAIDAIRQLPDQ